jgi:hypothetical protein
MKHSKIVHYFCVAGFVIPCVQFAGSLVAKEFLGYIAGPEFLILWPTSIVLMAAEGQRWPAGLVVLGLAILSNFAIYWLVGLAVAFMWQRRARPSK